jgi:AcrR family transcriptional regulator
MRVDAVRNLDAVLQTGARLLADDPTTSVATIAAEAGVDRRTVYRRFASREALLCAVFHAKLAAIDDVLDSCRLQEAPVAVALHRLVEGAIAVTRRYPIDTRDRGCPEGATAKVAEHRERVDAFLRRATDDGLIRSDLPDGMAGALLHCIIGLVGTQFRDLDCGRAADFAVETLLNGIGRS